METKSGPGYAFFFAQFSSSSLFFIGWGGQELDKFKQSSSLFLFFWFDQQPNKA